MARSGGWPPARRRILRERRQGGGRGGHQGQGDTGFLRRSHHHGPEQAVRTLAGPAGPDHPSHGEAPRRRPLCADRVGRGLRTHRHRTAAAEQPERGCFLYLRSGLQRSGVRLSTLRPGIRHQQPARLLEHVPRVDQHRPSGVDRNRQGQRQYRGRLPRQADHRGRAESRHQSPTDAVGAGDRQEERRQDHLDQPPPGGRAHQVQKPPGPQRGGRQGHQVVRPAPADQAQRRPGAAAGHRLAAGASGTPSTTTSSPGTPPVSNAGRHTSAPSTGTWSPRPPA